MLQALYKYGKEHLDPGPYGCKMRRPKWVVELSADGSFTGIRRYGEDEPGIWCPDVGTDIYGKGNSNVCMDKASVVFNLDGVDSPKFMEHRCFVSYFEYSMDRVPVFCTIMKPLSNSDLFSEIQDAFRDKIIKEKAKGSDMVTFAVSGRLICNMPEVLQWWSDKMRSKASCESFGSQAVDMVTGKACTPVRLFTDIPIKSAGGGKGSGCSFISFDKDAFRSYGFKNGENAPVSEDTMQIIIGALAKLGENAPKIGGMKFLHWYDREVDPSDDLLGPSGPIASFGAEFEASDDNNITPQEERAYNRNASDLVNSPWNGVVPVHLLGAEYYILVIRPEGKRLTVRHYSHGSYETLYQNIRKWYADMSLVSLDGMSHVRMKKLGWFLRNLSHSTGKDTRSDDAKYNRALCSQLINACIGGGSLPDAVLGKCLSDIRSEVYGKGIDAGTIQFLKLYLNRRRCRKEGDELMEGILKDEPLNWHIGYKCGRLLGVYSRLQQMVAGDDGRNALNRFYVSCCQSPGLTIGQMQRCYNYWSEKLTGYRYKKLFSDCLSEVYCTIDETLPVSFTPLEQGYFAVGYWQETARINQLIQDLKNNKKEEETADGSGTEQV